MILRSPDCVRLLLAVLSLMAAASYGSERRRRSDGSASAGGPKCPTSPDQDTILDVTSGECVGIGHAACAIRYSSSIPLRSFYDRALMKCVAVALCDELAGEVLDVEMNLCRTPTVVAPQLARTTSPALGMMLSRNATTTAGAPTVSVQIRCNVSRGVWNSSSENCACLPGFASDYSTLVSGGSPFDPGSTFIFCTVAVKDVPSQPPSDRSSRPVDLSRLLTLAMAGSPWAAAIVLIFLLAGTGLLCVATRALLRNFCRAPRHSEARKAAPRGKTEEELRKGIKKPRPRRNPHWDIWITSRRSQMKEALRMDDDEEEEVDSSTERRVMRAPRRALTFSSRQSGGPPLATDERMTSLRRHHHPNEPAEEDNPVSVERWKKSNRVNQQHVCISIDASAALGGYPSEEWDSFDSPQIASPSGSSCSAESIHFHDCTETEDTNPTNDDEEDEGDRTIHPDTQRNRGRNRCN
jgi:hypothetical protein